MIHAVCVVLSCLQEWSINLRRVKKHAYTCTIERYIFAHHCYNELYLVMFPAFHVATLKCWAECSLVPRPKDMNMDSSILFVLLYIPRPEQSSYLFFMNFAVSIIDHNVEAVEVFVSPASIPS